MICHDGRLEEAIPGCGLNETCRDGENECSPYKDCATITHDAVGCFDGNIVKCTDGESETFEDCVAEGQFCVANDEAEIGYICKDPDPTDCPWKETSVAKGQTVCDGNLLKTCSANVDTEFDEGTDCAELDPRKPICDPNIRREERYCFDGDIAPGVSQSDRRAQRRVLSRETCRDTSFCEIVPKAVRITDSTATHLFIF